MVNRKKLAELIDIILGDGSINIYDNHKRIQVTMHSEDDFKYSNYVSFLFFDLFNEVPIIKFRKNERALDVLIFKRKIIYFFLKLGMKKSPKLKRAKITKEFLSLDLGKYILRGIFDTDGSVVLTNNNGILYPRLEIKICESPMKYQIINLLKSYNFRFGVYDINDHQVRIQLNGKNELNKWNDLIGFSNVKHLNKMNIMMGKKPTN